MRRCIDPVDLSAWIDGEVGLRRSRAIRQHVESCPLCAAEVAALQRVRQTVRLLAGSEPGGAELWMVGQPVQRREAQRLLKRLRAELTKEQARVAWGRRSRANAWRPVLWASPAVAFVLLLVVGITGSLRGSLLSGLPGSPDPALQPVVSRDNRGDRGIPAMPVPVRGRSAVTEADSYLAEDGMGDDAGRDERVEQRSVALNSAGSPVAEEESGANQSFYARGGVKFAPTQAQVLEGYELVFWRDEGAASTWTPGDLAGASSRPVVLSLPTERVMAEANGGREMHGASGADVASGGLADNFPGTDIIQIGTAGVSVLPDAGGATAGKPESGRVLVGAGVRPAAASTVSPATAGSAATGDKKGATRAGGKDEPSDESGRSESEYQREHDRYAATIAVAPVDSSEEALIKRVLLAATGP